MAESLSLADIQADRDDAILRAINLLDSNPVIFDTETTGLTDAEIVEIAAVDWQGNVLIDTIVAPKGKIEHGAVEIHGITNAQTRGAPTIAEIMPQIHEAFAGRTLTSYNLDFDTRMLRQSCAMRHKEAWHAFEWLKASVTTTDCIMDLYARWYGEWNDYHGSYTWKALGAACKALGVKPQKPAHRALSDAKMALGVLQALARS